MYAQNHFSPQYSTNYPPFGGNWYYPAQENWQQPYPDNQNPTEAILLKRRENEKLIESFVEESEKTCSEANKAESDDKKTFKISEIREVVINVYDMQEKLETVSKEMKNNENLSDLEWEEKWRECKELKGELAKLFDTIAGSQSVVDALKKKVEQRKRKRLREVKKKAERKAEKALAIERRSQRHAEADAWIREKQDIVEREKQVELLRKDADIVLADVRGKRSDARKNLAILQELQNLRRVKVNIARGRGENLPIAADQAFDNIIGQLLDQWTSLDGEYAIEEQGLKLMLKADNEQKIEKQKRSTFDDWESVLFGKKLQSYDPNRGDAHTLVIIRHAWDKYANYKGAGSRIPIGWIMPEKPYSAAWQKCLRRE